MLGRGVERAKHLFARLGRPFVADDAEQVAAMVDLDAEAQLDLADVLVERAAEIGEAVVILGVEGEIALGQLAHGVHEANATSPSRTTRPRSELLMASVIVTSMNWPIMRAWPGKLT